MRNDIKVVTQAGFTNIHVKGDNKILIQVPWEIQVLTQDIHLYIQLCNNVFITHIFRQENCAADYLVKHDLSLYSTVVWKEVPHMDILRIFYEDNLGRTLERMTN